MCLEHSRYILNMSVIRFHGIGVVYRNNKGFKWWDRRMELILYEGRYRIAIDRENVVSVGTCLFPLEQTRRKVNLMIRQ